MTFYNEMPGFLWEPWVQIKADQTLILYHNCNGLNTELKQASAARPLTKQGNFNHWNSITFY